MKMIWIIVNNLKVKGITGLSSMVFQLKLGNIIFLLQWKEWEPPQWVDRCKPVELRGTFSVPTQLLGKTFYIFLMLTLQAEISHVPT